MESGGRGTATQVAGAAKGGREGEEGGREGEIREMEGRRKERK